MTEPAPPTTYGLKADLAKLQCRREHLQDIYGPKDEYIQYLVAQENCLRQQIERLRSGI
jgi:capsule polysaccharide export protein KpsE/RkpR